MNNKMRALRDLLDRCKANLEAGEIDLARSWLEEARQIALEAHAINGEIIDGLHRIEEKANLDRSFHNKVL